MNLKLFAKERVLVRARWCLRRLALVPALSAAVLLAGPTSEISKPVVLENEFLRLTLDPRTGAILSLANVKTGAEYMAPRATGRPS